jgi:hypothetical protein
VRATVVPPSALPAPAITTCDGLSRPHSFEKRIFEHDAWLRQSCPLLEEIMERLRVLISARASSTDHRHNSSSTSYAKRFHERDYMQSQKIVTDTTLSGC